MSASLQYYLDVVVAVADICTGQGKQQEQVRFLFDGQRIQAEHTPEQVGSLLWLRREERGKYVLTL